MIKHKYNFRTYKTDHKWSVYFQHHLNEKEQPGHEKFYDDMHGGFYCLYYGPVEVDEIYVEGKLAGHREKTNENKKTVTERA